MKESKELTVSINEIPATDYEHRMQKVMDILIDETLIVERKIISYNNNIMSLDEHYEKLKDQMTREEFNKMIESLDKFAHYAFDKYKE